MGKLIDADRLRAEIEKTYKSEIAPWLSGVSATSAIYDYVLPLIDFIQQEQQEVDFPLPEDTVLFNKGVEEGKRLMMKEAVEGEIENASFGIVYLRKNLVNEGYSTGDKVRVIIVKED